MTVGNHGARADIIGIGIEIVAGTVGIPDTGTAVTIMVGTEAVIKAGAHDNIANIGDDITIAGLPIVRGGAGSDAGASGYRG